ncbi:MAG: L-histidine N(alpha)-methyltransferase [Pirellulales bacterium]|nr:L-histidine N(alpha)-methyltransferase [Pirellulales bacterium]
MPQESTTTLLDFTPATKQFHADVVDGLSQQPPSLPCKYFYDERGSQLFDEICELDEYYLTRTELEIMSRHADEMAEQIGPGAMLIEYGSGSSVKTRMLLDHLDDPVAYVPVDISRDHLHHNANELASQYPAIEMLPVCADFVEHFELPVPKRKQTHNAVYFPGSTIGNFEPKAAEDMLKRIVSLCGCGGGLLLGIDLQKDPHVIEAAYNDQQGVTAKFNLNLLERIDRELDAEVQVEQFAHRAVYNEPRGRVEIDVVSLDDQEIRVGDETFEFEAGDTIRTEYSHKYTIDGFAELAAGAGLELHREWTDPKHHFAVLHFAVMD